jgi:3',5'-cyclic AMP phosphodiesterase CpdA
MGNHDLNKGSRRLYEDIFGPTYYAFQINDNYFIVVDDASPEALDHRQLSWLEQELQKARAYPRRFVFLHIPLFDPRGEKHDHCLPAESGRKLASLFQKYRVTHIFTGHIHAYFSGQWSGVPFTITGGAGGKIKHPDQEHYFFHYVKVSIRGDQVRLEVQRLPGFYPGKF